MESHRVSIPPPATVKEQETHRLVARLVVDMHERAVDLRKLLELVLQRLRAADLKMSVRRRQARAEPSPSRRTHTSCATSSVVSPFMTKSTSMTYRGPLWYTMHESIPSIWSANVIAL